MEWRISLLGSFERRSEAGEPSVPGSLRRGNGTLEAAFLGANLGIDAADRTRLVALLCPC